MSLAIQNENASQLNSTAKQVGAGEVSAQGTGAVSPKSAAATTKGQPRRSKPASCAVPSRNKTSLQYSAGRTTSSTPAASTRPKEGSKQDTVLELLRQTEGATIDELMDATAWQAHSIRGFLSGTIRKKLKLHLISDVVGNGVRRYRVVSPDQAGRGGEPADQPVAEGTQGA